MRLFVTIVALGLASAAAGAQANQTMLTMLRGECQETLNGVPIGCDNKGVLTNLPNGRTIFNFTGTTIATVGFAGEMKPTTPGNKVLWVTGAYINQTRFTADGQCTIKAEGDRVSVTCNAILNASAEIEPIPATGAAQSTSSGNCEGILKTHAFLSRAQFQCGYRYYNQEMTDAARACMPQFQESEARSLMMSGMETFDRNERGKGYRAVCAGILRTFPKFVRQ